MTEKKMEYDQMLKEGIMAWMQGAGRATACLVAALDQESDVEISRIKLDVSKRIAVTFLQNCLLSAAQNGGKEAAERAREELVKEIQKFDAEQALEECNKIAEAIDTVFAMIVTLGDDEPDKSKMH